MTEVPAEAPIGRQRLLLGLILAAGAGLRFTSLYSLPIFNDEAIYALWLRSITGGHWLVSFGDGKQPLYYWLAALVSGLVNDPLAGLRLTAGLAGMAGIAGAYLAGTAIADRRVGLAAAWVYAIVPYMVVNDRLGLGDGLVAALALYIFWAAVLLGRAPGWRFAAVLGGLLGLALLVKTTAILLVPAAVSGMIIGRLQTGPAPVGGRESATVDRGFDKLTSRGLAALFIASIPTVAVIAFARNGAFVIGKSSSFLLTMPEITAIPYQHWLANLALVSRWLINYLQWPALVLIGAALAVGRRRLKVDMYMLVIAAAVPPLFMVVAARTWFSRYAALSVPFMVLAAALAYAAVGEALPAGRWKRAIPLLAVALLTAVALKQDVLLIQAPARFAWAPDDRWQYIEGWPSGYGLDSAVKYLRRRTAAAGPGGIGVLVDANMGFPYDGLRLAGMGPKTELIPVKGSKHLPKVQPDGRSYFYIADDPRLNRPGFAKNHRRWPLVATFPKPGKESSWNIYQWQPNQY